MAHRTTYARMVTTDGRDIGQSDICSRLGLRLHGNLRFVSASHKGELTFSYGGDHETEPCTVVATPWGSFRWKVEARFHRLIG